MVTEGELFALGGDIYDAALDGKQWPFVLERIADTVGGTATGLSLHDRSRRWGMILAKARLDDAWQAKYDEHFCQINPHAQATAQLATGALTTGQMIVSDSELSRSEYYHEFLKPQQMFHLTGSVIAREGTLEYLFTTYRPHQKKGFDEGDLAPLKFVLPHLARAARISRELTAAGKVLQTFESLSFGLVLIDRLGRAVIMNSRAEQIFNQNDGLALGQCGELRTDTVFQDTLLASILRVVRKPRGEYLETPRDVLVPRPSGKKPYRLSITPLAIASHVREFNQVAGAIFLSDPERGLPVQADLLNRCYGVTKREAEVASLLAQGKDLNEICEALAIRKSTARTHISSLMGKLGVKRQSHIVSFLAGMVSPAGR